MGLLGAVWVSWGWAQLNGRFSGADLKAQYRARLKPSPRLAQKRQLFGLGLAAQQGIAVGVTVEAVDDFFMAQLKA